MLKTFVQSIKALHQTCWEHTNLRQKDVNLAIDTKGKRGIPPLTFALYEQIRFHHFVCMCCVIEKVKIIVLCCLLLEKFSDRNKCSF